MNDAPYVYIVMGDPTPLARVRFVNRRVWDSQKADKLHFALHLKYLHGNKPLFAGPLHLQVTFFFPIPHSRRKKKDELAGSYHHYKPDISNLIKFVEDCASGILFHDDALIAQITSKKLYDLNEPRTEFIITPLLKEVYERSRNNPSSQQG